MPECALGHLHFFNLQQVKHRLQDRQATANDGFAVFFDAFQPQMFGPLGFEQAVFQPAQAFARHFAFWPACGGQHIGDSPDRAGCAIAGVPVASVEQHLGFVQHGFGADFGCLKCRGCPNTFRKKFHRPSHTAHTVRLQRAGDFVLAQDHFSRASANVNHQSALSRLGQQVRHPQINQPCFFFASNDFDRETQNAFGFGQKNIAVACFAQGLCGHGAHMAGPKARNALTKSGQAIPAALHGFFGQIAFGIQAIALSHGLFDVLHAAQLTRIHLTNFEPKTVRAQVNGSIKGLGLHEERRRNN